MFWTLKAIHKIIHATQKKNLIAVSLAFEIKVFNADRRYMYNNFLVEITSSNQRD